MYRVLKTLGKLQAPCGCKRERSEPPPPPDVERIGLIVGLDYTHWRGQPICNVIEFESRYCLASEVCSRETGDEAKRVMQLALKRARALGLPVQGITVKSDHGSPFRSEVFEDYIAARQCYRDYSAVGRPQGMGRVERFNRSEKEQSLKWEDAQQRDEIQQVCDAYRRFYNHKRPHQALAYQTPAHVVRLLVPKVVPLK